MKKISNTVKFVIVVAAFLVVFIGLAIGAAFASPARASDSIDAIGKVSYTAESKQKIDAAIADYEAIGENTLGESTLFGESYLASTNREELKEKLTEAEKEYVRLAIKTATVAEKRKIADGYTNAQLAQIVAEARAATDEYFKDNYDEVETYADLVALEEKYGKVETSDEDASNADEKEEQIELC
jgi:hypothetical protein